MFYIVTAGSELRNTAKGSLFGAVNHGFYRTQTNININRTQASERAEKCRYCPWWPWPLTFDLDLQTRLSEGPNTSSVWICCKSVQQFQRYFICKQKSHRQRQNRTLRSSLHVVTTKADSYAVLHWKIL